jgi:glutamine synthetase
MHFHQHLFSKGKNVFYDASGYGCLSQEALYYIGGLLAHGPALLALTNPSTNSYRRLIPGFEAPVNAFFSLGNRSAAVRSMMIWRFAKANGVASTLSAAAPEALAASIAGTISSDRPTG